MMCIPLRSVRVRYGDIYGGIFMEKMGVGVIGYGFIGKVHALAYRAIPLLYDPLPIQPELVGVCALTEKSRTKAVQQAGFKFAASDYHELLERDDIRIIHICTPNDMHHRQVLDAIEAGKHVYCDKPLALNVEQAVEMTEASDKSSSVCGMTFNYRFIPATMRAKELIEEGFIGEPIHFRAAYLHAGYLDPMRPYSWRMDMERSGGGAIMDLGVHIFDLIRYLLGDAYEVHAMLETRFPQRLDPNTGTLQAVKVDDFAIVQIRMQNGAAGVIEASRLATGKQDELRFEIHGTKGALSFNMMDPNWLVAYDESIREAPLGGNRGEQKIECVARYPKPFALGIAKNTIGWQQFHFHSLYSFLSAVAHEGARIPNFHDGLAAQRFVEATQKSNSDRIWTALN